MLNVVLKIKPYRKSSSSLIFSLMQKSHVLNEVQLFYNNNVIM